VPQLFIYKKGKFARSVLASLRRPTPGLSYKIAANIYDAAVLGVPQQRRRALIIGVQVGEGEVHPPDLPSLSWYFTARRRGKKINGYSSEIDKILGDPNDDRLVNVSQAFGDLPILSAGASEVERKYRHPPNTAYQKFIRGNRNKVTATATPCIKKKTAKRIRALGPGECVKDLPQHLVGNLGRKFASAYRRLHSEVPATTLFTKFDCAFHPTAVRALSVREYARLQSIPDWYRFSLSARHSYAMIGNAVPPLMVARILLLALTLD
jgi:DNA (cytosine-5)-methyltransferase 1